MNDQIKSTKRNYLMEDVLRNRKGKANYKYFSPIQNSRTKLHKGNILINKLYIKELSKLSDRPILVNKTKIKTNIQKQQYLSKDKINKNYVNSTSMIDNSDNSYNDKNNFIKSVDRNNKNFIIFKECPKKISDYILKNNNKKKVYQLTYCNENDLNYEKFINERIYKTNYNSNRDYNPQLMKKKKKIFNLNTYDEQYYLTNDIYNITNANTNDNYKYKFNNTFSKNIKKLKKDYSMKNLCVNNQNKDQLKVLKIQSIWRGYLIRKILLKSLNNLYNIMKLINSLYAIFYNNYKPIFKLFLYSLLKKNKDIEKLKSINVNINSKTNIRPYTYYKENKNIISNINNNLNNKKTIKDKISLKNKISEIDKKNINVFLPGDKQTNQTNQLAKKNFIYKRKKNSIKNSPLLTKNNFNLNKNNANNRENNNLKIKGKANNYDEFKNVNYKNKSKIEINNIVNYIIKKNILLYSPLFLYRLRIIQKMKLVEYRYKCLFNIIKIKEKLILYTYFHKYRNIVSFLTANNMLFEKQSKENSSLPNNAKNKLVKDNKNNNYKLGKKYYLNNNKQNINNNNLNIYCNNFTNENILGNNINNNENTLNNKSNIKIKENYINKNISLKKNNANIIMNKKYEILNTIIYRKESKINNIFLNKAFNKWKNIIQNIIVLPKLRNDGYNKCKPTKLVLNDNKISVISKKKSIKVRKIKSERSNNFSKAKSINSGKLSLNSFESDNINVRKMKVQKIKIFNDSKNIKNSLTKEFEPKNKNSIFIDNSQFIQKIANISRKITDKNNIFKSFIFWKKKTKEIN